MKRLFALLVAACLLLCACGTQTPTQPSTVATKPATTPPTTEPSTAPPTTEPTTVPTTAATEPAVQIRHPLTGELLDEPFTGRCVAVATNNASAAQPQHGIGQADILYEIMAEGGGSITRCLAVYSNIAEVPKVGSIRSARTYLVNLARGHNAPIVHCGGSSYAGQLLAQGVCDDMDQFYNSKYFYRDQDRVNAGYAWEHTLFASGESLWNCLKARSYATESTYEIVPAFSENATPDGETANTVTVQFNSGGKQTELTYQAESGCYTAMQHWYNKSHPFMDQNTGEKVQFKNVFVLYTKCWKIEAGVSNVAYELEGSGEGYFACGGKIIPIRWHRDSLDRPMTYTLTDGTPLTQGVGKTYVAILPLNSPMSYN